MRNRGASWDFVDKLQLSSKRQFSVPSAVTKPIVDQMALERRFLAPANKRANREAGDKADDDGSGFDQSRFQSYGQQRNGNVRPRGNRGGFKNSRFRPPSNAATATGQSSNSPATGSVPLPAASPVTSNTSSSDRTRSLPVAQGGADRQ
jgi:hypothetical protein